MQIQLKNTRRIVDRSAFSNKVKKKKELDITPSVLCILTTAFNELLCHILRLEDKNYTKFKAVSSGRAIKILLS